MANRATSRSNWDTLPAGLETSIRTATHTLENNLAEASDTDSTQHAQNHEPNNLLDQIEMQQERLQELKANRQRKMDLCDRMKASVVANQRIQDKHINALTMTNLGQGKMNEQLREQSNAANRISDKLCYEVDRLTIAHQHDIRLVQEEDQDARQLQDSVNSLNLKHEQARSEYEVQISAFKTRATTQQQVHEQACSDLNTAKCRIRDPEAEATLRKSTYTETRSNLITANSRIQELETALDKARKDRASEQAGFATILGELSTQIQNLRASKLEVDNQVDTLRTQHNQEWSDLLAKVDSLNSQVLSSDESKLEAEAKVDTLLTQH